MLAVPEEPALNLRYHALICRQRSQTRREWGGLTGADNGVNPHFQSIRRVARQHCMTGMVRESCNNREGGKDGRRQLRDFNRAGGRAMDGGMVGGGGGGDRHRLLKRGEAAAALLPLLKCARRRHRASARGDGETVSERGKGR